MGATELKHSACCVDASALHIAEDVATKRPSGLLSAHFLARIVAFFIILTAAATLHAHGLGDYIQRASVAGDFHRIILGTAVMALLVSIINRIFWRPLYWYAERKYRLT